MCIIVKPLCYVLCTHAATWSPNQAGHVKRNATVRKPWHRIQLQTFWLEADTSILHKTWYLITSRDALLHVSNVLQHRSVDQESHDVDNTTTRSQANHGTYVNYRHTEHSDLTAKVCSLPQVRWSSRFPSHQPKQHLNPPCFARARIFKETWDDAWTIRRSQGDRSGGGSGQSYYYHYYHYYQYYYCYAYYYYFYYYYYYYYSTINITIIIIIIIIISITLLLLFHADSQRELARSCRESAMAQSARMSSRGGAGTRAEGARRSGVRATP